MTLITVTCKYNYSIYYFNINIIVYYVQTIKEMGNKQTITNNNNFLENFILVLDNISECYTKQ